MAIPDSAAALEQAIGLLRGGEPEAAERLLLDLVAQEPAFARAWNALGVVQMQQGRLEQAEASLLRAAQVAPQESRAHLNLGKLYGLLGRAADTERHLRDAIRLDPGNPDAQFSLGAFFLQRGRADEAETSLRKALALAPQDAEAHYALARVLLATGRIALAEASFLEAIRLRPDYAVARSDLAMVLLESGRLREAQASCEAALRAAPDFLRAWSNFVMCGQYDPDAPDEALLARAKQAGKAIHASASRFEAPIAPPNALAPMFHLGIVSGDLHHHPVGLLLLPLLRELGGLGVKTTLYSNGAVVDGISQELAGLAQWSDIATLPDEQAWTRIRGDRPDVLIDLAGHTGNNRLPIFAARAAPLQLSWLGYFATTGTPNMDCVLMDPWHAPPGSESQFTERVLRMPHTRFCFQPIDASPPVAPKPPSADGGGITFGSFNNVGKLNAQVIDAWSKVLQAVPGSRLVLKWRTLVDASCRAALANRFRDAGVAPERIEMRPASDHVGVLREYADIDIALDSFPFTGGQTSLDALWMGVPVVTLAGRRPVSRQTLCWLGNVGLEDLAADTVDGFVGRAVALAMDPPRLRELRATLRPRMQASPLMQAPDFARVFVAQLRDASRPVV